ncbi:MAG: DoxX family membrane protein [Candidatus Woesearchaeota archaeon]
MKMKSLAIPSLRYAMGLVFIYFGSNQLMNPNRWTALVPDWIQNIVSANTVVTMNGIFEIIFGILLILGLFTKLASLLLALHLVGITIGMGYNPVGVRDFGLTIATFAIFVSDVDEYCLDNKVRTKRKNKIF